MENFDLVILTLLVSFSFIIFIALTLREFSKAAKQDKR